MMYGYGPGFGGGFGIVGGILMLVFWAAIIFAIIVFIRSVSGCRGKGCRGLHFHGSDEDSAISLLRERYARGEMDKKEFEERKRTLEEDRHSEKK